MYLAGSTETQAMIATLTAQLSAAAKAKNTVLQQELSKQLNILRMQLPKDLAAERAMAALALTQEAAPEVATEPTLLGLPRTAVLVGGLALVTVGWFLLRRR